MHPRTEKLRAIMAQYKLSAEDVAEMLTREIITVRIWRCKNKRVIPSDALKLLEIKAVAKAVA